MIKMEKENVAPFVESGLGVHKHKALVGKYLSQIGFPHFIKSTRE